MFRSINSKTIGVFFTTTNPFVMANRSMQLFMFVSVITLVIGCRSSPFTKVVDVDLDNPEPVDVLYARWNTSDTMLFVVVTESVGADNSAVPAGKAGLQVSISIEGGSRISFEERSDVEFSQRFFGGSDALIGSVYTLRTPAEIEPGVRVDLLVEGLANGATLSSISSFPSVGSIAAEVTEAPEVDTIFFGPGPDDFFIESSGGEISVQLQDSPVEGENYIIQAEQRRIEIDTQTMRQDTFTLFSSSLFGRDEDTRFQYVYEQSVFRDILNNGELVSVPFDYFLSGQSMPGVNFRDEVVVFYDKLSPEMYTYLFEREVVDLADGNPFAEPVVLASNVEGGLGHFLLSSRSEKVVVE